MASFYQYDTIITWIARIGVGRKIYVEIDTVVGLWEGVGGEIYGNGVSTERYSWGCDGDGKSLFLLYHALEMQFLW